MVNSDITANAVITGISSNAAFAGVTAFTVIECNAYITSNGSISAIPCNDSNTGNAINTGNSLARAMSDQGSGGAFARATPSRPGAVRLTGGLTENAHLDVSKLLNWLSATKVAACGQLGLLGERSDDLHVSRAFVQGRSGLGDR